MKLDDFHFDLPPDRIAQEPASIRDQSRLMVLHRKTKVIEHRRFCDLPEYFRSGDALVVNDTKVLPVRLLGKKESGGQVEILLVSKISAGEKDDGLEEWQCLAQSNRPLRPNTRLFFAEGISGELVETSSPGLWRFRLWGGDGHSDRLARIGYAPLPPYIHRNGDEQRRMLDLERYQTVYARSEGAIAAPTAGLHFTPALLDRLQAMGVGLYSLTLHVGIGTFRPVKAEEIEGHRLEAEYFEIPPATAQGINQRRSLGHRIFAVGTTVTRALETQVDDHGMIRPGRGQTELFIYPGHRFRAIDALVTNFHLPRSTLLMLVCAFAGREWILACYQEAIREGYRFYSYGDAMLIL